MFKKIKCKKCGEKVKTSFNFCPNCNFPLKKETKKEDYGILGKNDVEENPMQNSLFGGFGEGMLNKMLGSAMKMLEKEMQKEMNQPKSGAPKSNMRLMINGKEIDLNGMQKKEPKKVIQKNLKVNMSKESAEKFSKLPKKEPKTNVTRLPDKIVYELNIPEIQSLEDVSILQLEKSIEVKAISKNNSYAKIIQIGLPVIGYGITKENLFLEFPVQ
jgi:hypothetical protein